MTHPDASQLAAVPLFAGLADEDLQLLASWFDVEEYPEGLRVIADQAEGFAFYVLASGRAHAEHEGHLLEAFEPGAAFGEIAFYASDGLRTADVVPDTDITVYSLFGTRFRDMQAKMPDLAARVQELAEQRVHRGTGPLPPTP